ncbi:hypothetical protein FBU59_001180 [Linderina macrospora]|uniref:Uncharacterized protein n=1 Tax=Linderina macrospora TaxID=4868 RepID=A0ACC1JF01_9FUNG|nr:hypothetical protein FBU59_001180 [Linderina macrospora]
MSFVGACCNTPPVKAEYTKTGEIRTVGGVDIYIVGPTSSKFGIILCYDVFGFHPNVFQFADILGNAGFRVAIPDFLEGNPITEADVGKPGLFAEFAAKRGPWSFNKATYEKARKILLDDGAEKIGSVGLCWGAKLAVNALAEERAVAAALIHPSMLVAEDFANATGPIMLIETKDEKNLSEEFALAKSRFALSRRDRYEDMHHGFTGARGDYSKREQADRAHQAITATIKFFADVAN